MVFKPYAGADVQGGHLALGICWRGGDALEESQPEQISEEMVIAIPTPVVVQGDEEQVSAFEVFQGGLPDGCGVEENGITQATRHPLKDGRVQQERLDALGLLPEDFFHQVVQHEMVTTGE